MTVLRNHAQYLESGTDTKQNYLVFPNGRLHGDLTLQLPIGKNHSSLYLKAIGPSPFCTCLYYLEYLIYYIVYISYLLYNIYFIHGKYNVSERGNPT